MKTCKQCQGSGIRNEPHQIETAPVCIYCDGSGEIPDELKLRDLTDDEAALLDTLVVCDLDETPDLCEVCGGTGVNGTEGNPDEDLTNQWNDKPCLTCEGTGYV